MNSVLNDALQKVLDTHKLIDSDPRIKELDHQLSVCNKWLEEESSIELTEKLYTLRSERNTLEEIIDAVANKKSKFKSTYLWRLNGEPGEYNDTSGSLLEICNRWSAIGVLKTYPEFKTGIDITNKLSLGDHIKINDDGTISITVVTNRVEEIPQAEKDSSMNFRYSESELSTVNLDFANLETLTKRLEFVTAEYEKLVNSSEYKLLENTRKQVILFKEQRETIAKEIKDSELN